MKVLAITAVRITHYADNGQTLGHVSWSDGSRTSGDPGGAHMQALIARAARDGLLIARDQWGTPVLTA